MTLKKGKRTRRSFRCRRPLVGPQQLRFNQVPTTNRRSHFSIDQLVVRSSPICIADADCSAAHRRSQFAGSTARRKLDADLGIGSGGEVCRIERQQVVGCAERSIQDNDGLSFEFSFKFDRQQSVLCGASASIRLLQRNIVPPSWQRTTTTPYCWRLTIDANRQMDRRAGRRTGGLIR